MMDAIQRAVPVPQAEVIMHGASGRQILGQRAPLAAGAENVHHAVDHLADSDAPVRRGGWPCGWITAPSICRTTSPTRSSSGASSRPTPSSNSPRPTASPRGSIARSRNRSSMAASTATSRSCGTPSAGSSNSPVHAVGPSPRNLQSLEQA